MDKLIVGDFEGERFWQDDRIVRLPNISSTESKNIVLAMDELQAIFSCNDSNINSYLFTRFKMNATHRDYLHDIGFKFNNLYCSVNNGFNYDKSSYKCLYEDNDGKEEIKGLNLDPFVINEYADDIKCKLLCKGEFSSHKLVKEVNSKKYSSIMRERIDCKNIAKYASSADEIEKIVLENNKNNLKSIIKENYGVSGKGNICVEYGPISQRIVEQIRSKERKGQLVELIVEPLLDKYYHFSCLFYIDKFGTIDIMSTQKVLNNGLSYGGSVSIESDILKLLDRNQYYKKIEEIGKQMYSDGYIGDVCIDSMILRNGNIVEIVEINARKSMSLLKHYVDIFLQKYYLQGMLAQFDFIGGFEQIDYDNLLSGLDGIGLLFTPMNNRGIIILSERTMFINKSAGRKYRGRVYCVICADSFKHICETYDKFKLYMKDSGFKLV